MSALVVAFAIAFAAAMGAPDHRIGRELGMPEGEVRRLRQGMGLRKRGWVLA